MRPAKIISCITIGTSLVMSVGLIAYASTHLNLPTSIRLESTKLGRVYATSTGKTVYEFKKDVPHSHKSACYGKCATLWPPVVAPAKFKPMKPWGIATRKGGKKQLTYQGYPLYTWIKDTKPGDVSGQGVKGVWRVVKSGKKQISWTTKP
ncbi:hypothetical protein ACMS1Z_18890 [Acidiphilium multivorum]|uniref:COG4315 family predicted lipoprotein n=1 Tax=Acidiphilium multivorum TaxID=62140 RepID=UPI0039C9C0DA